ncbi:MAG: phosphoribosylformylglycinamidine synthase I [Candidatus Omnitrophica bacterium]|nr:phosphoribosylformylglycinamidine synthase I [Candidatus Omnitrophota bacterium]
MTKPRALVLRTAGTNCDRETAFAFELAGAATEFVHINELTARRRELNDYHILALPGGFTYGDDIASGKILANELTYKLEDSLQKFVSDGKLIIGICNGFQILVKAGLLPNISGDFQTIEATLTLNDSNKFEDRWVYLKKLKSKCIWTENMGKIIHLPVAHGEGKFIPRDNKALKILKDNGMIALEYVDGSGHKCGYPCNPNGSVENIAGICDKTGRIFGLMPHPERHISFYQSPYWTKNKSSKRGEGDGFSIFASGVNFAKKHL